MLQFKLRQLLLLGTLLSAAAGAQQAAHDGLAPPAPIIERALPAYLAGRAARFVGWLDDGSLLIATRFGDTEQIHRVRTPLGAREQQTFLPDGVLAAAAQPRRPDSLALLAPRPDGGEQLMLQSATGIAPRPLTDGHSRSGPPLWSHDGRHVALTSAARGHECVVEMLEVPAVPGPDAAPLPAPRQIAADAGYCWRVLDWSADDQRLLLGRQKLPDSPPEVPAADAPELELFTADSSGGALTPLMLSRASEPAPEHRSRKSRRSGAGSPPPATALRARSARFAPDGRGLLLLRSGEGDSADFVQLQQLEPDTTQPRTLSADSAGDVELFDESADGHYLAYTSEDAGLSRLTLVDRQRKLDLNPAAIPPGIISSIAFDPSGRRLALTIATARAAADVYVLEPATQQLTRWTQSEPGPIDPGSLVTPTLVRFPTWDRIGGQPRMLTAYAWRPAATPGPRPVLILLRSGGGTQYRPEFDPLIQFLVREMGFVVLAPNVRGSAGSGSSFERLARGDLRDDAARDIGSLLVWIGLQRELDFNHIVVMGEGYGAYLALASLAEYGDRLIGAIAAFPPHLGSINSLLPIRRPVLLVHGRHDPDAPAYEFEQLAARLRAHGNAVQYLGAEEEGARFVRRANRDAYATAAAGFLYRLTH